jgi:hypothetical protein
MLRATSLSIVVQLEDVRDMRVSACEYNMLLVTFTLAVYIGETRRTRSHRTTLQILANTQFPYSDVGVAIPNDVDLNHDEAVLVKAAGLGSPKLGAEV